MQGVSSALNSMFPPLPSAPRFLLSLAEIGTDLSQAVTFRAKSRRSVLPIVLRRRKAPPRHDATDPRGTGISLLAALTTTAAGGRGWSQAAGACIFREYARDVRHNTDRLDFDPAMPGNEPMEVARLDVIISTNMPPDGEAPDHVEIEEHDGFLEARFFGSFKADRFNRQVDAAVLACRERNLTLLLIDATRLKSELSTVDRFEIGSYGARVASHLRVAVFGPPELLDPKKFGAKVAQNRGLTIDTFTDHRRRSTGSWPPTSGAIPYLDKPPDERQLILTIRGLL